MNPASLSTLQQLVDDGVVDEVLQQIKSGKEAEVYLARKGERLLAAKLYKARDERNFKNNAGYLEGRNVRSSRDARAMAKGSRYGRSQQEERWKHAEVDALYKLHAAGVRVPAPDVFYEGVLVMDLVVNAEGYPAPRIADVQLDGPTAKAMYLDLLRQVGIMLSCDLIHGDLSPFNVLLAHDGPTIIDLPQVVNAAGNPQAEMFFRRDVGNLHRYFAQFAPELGGRPDGGADLWGRYKRQELFAGYVPDLATLVDDAPVPTFKPKHENRRGPRRGRGPGAGPEVVYKGQAPAPSAPAPERTHPKPAARPEAHAQHGAHRSGANPGGHKPQGGPPRQGGPRPQHGQPRSSGQGGQHGGQGQHAAGQGQPRAGGHGGQQGGQGSHPTGHAQPRPGGQHGQPRQPQHQGSPRGGSQAPQGGPRRPQQSQHGQPRPAGQPRPGQQAPQGQPRPGGSNGQRHASPPGQQGRPATSNAPGAPHANVAQPGRPPNPGGAQHHRRRRRPHGGPPRGP